MSFRVFGIGEVLWNLLPTGNQLGGAPANLTYHAQNRGAEASLITRIGDDALGKEALRKFKCRCDMFWQLIAEKRPYLQCNHRYFASRAKKFIDSA